MKSIKALLVPVLMLGLLPLAGTAVSKVPTAPPSHPSPSSSTSPPTSTSNVPAASPSASPPRTARSSCRPTPERPTSTRTPRPLPGAGDFADRLLQPDPQLALHRRRQDVEVRRRRRGRRPVRTARIVRFLRPRPHDGRRRSHLQRRDQPRQRRGVLEPRRRTVVARRQPGRCIGRPSWVTGKLEDEVFLYVNLPKQLWRSHGRRAHLLSSCGRDQRPFPADGKLLVDPLNPESGSARPPRTGRRRDLPGQRRSRGRPTRLRSASRRSSSERSPPTAPAGSTRRTPAVTTAPTTRSPTAR